MKIDYHKNIQRLNKKRFSKIGREGQECIIIKKRQMRKYSSRNIKDKLRLDKIRQIRRSLHLKVKEIQMKY